jgi:hypothetical protein
VIKLPQEWWIEPGVYYSALIGLSITSYPLAVFQSGTRVVEVARPSFDRNTKGHRMNQSGASGGLQQGGISGRSASETSHSETAPRPAFSSTVSILDVAKYSKLCSRPLWDARLPLGACPGHGPSLERADPRHDPLCTSGRTRSKRVRRPPCGALHDERGQLGVGGGRGNGSSSLYLSYLAGSRITTAESLLRFPRTLRHAWASRPAPCARRAALRRNRPTWRSDS